MGNECFFLERGNSMVHLGALHFVNLSVNLHINVTLLLADSHLSHCFIVLPLINNQKGVSVFIEDNIVYVLFFDFDFWKLALNVNSTVNSNAFSLSLHLISFIYLYFYFIL